MRYYRISEADLKLLIQDSKTLESLHAHLVDDWEGYDEAISDPDYEISADDLAEYEPLEDHPSAARKRYNAAPKNALRELCAILRIMGIFVSEHENDLPSWLKTEVRKYPGCLAGSGRDVSEDDIKELKNEFNKAVNMSSTFGHKIHPSRAYGDSMAIVIPADAADALEKLGPTGLLKSFRKELRTGKRS
jgi:hypothetical protein